MRSRATTLAFASLGGCLFYLLHTPLPWTLGPLVATFICKIRFKQAIDWPKSYRNTGLVALGCAMGSPFTLDMGQQMLNQLPGMFAATLATIVLSLCTGWVVSRITHIGVINGLIGSIPGGLHQMSVLCEEIPGANLSIITLMQTLRLITVVFVVPFLAVYGLSPSSVSQVAGSLTVAADWPVFSLYAICAILAAGAAHLLHFPTPFFFGPVFSTVALVIIGQPSLHVPSLILAFAQILVGIRMGSDLSLTGIKTWNSVIWYNLLAVLFLIVASLGIDYFLMQAYSLSLLTAFIGTAPGGITEMGLTAMTVHADVSLVMAYQLFRLLFILLIAIPLVKWYLTHFPQQVNTSRL